MLSLSNIKKQIYVEVTVKMDSRYDKIIQFIQEGAPILTINRRLSRYLVALYDEFMAHSGAKGWISPEIMPLISWLEKLRTDLAPDKTVLSASRADALWRSSAPSAKGAGRNFDLSTPGVAELAYEAYTLCVQYGIALPEGFYSTDETEILSAWTKSYEARAEELGFIDPARLPGLLTGSCRSNKHLLPPRIVLAGFDELPPAIARFIDELKEIGAEIILWPSADSVADKPGKTGAARFPSIKDEVMQAARWARANAAPGKKIAFIVPDMRSYRDLILREFSAELDPESVIPWKRSTPKFNVSLGETLSNDALVKSALDILSIHPGKNDLKSLTTVILNNYFADTCESLALARIDAELKKDLRLNSSIQEIRQKCERHGAAVLARRFEIWIRIINEMPKTAYPRQWAHAFTGLLKDIGWLGHVKLSSDEFQSLEAWGVLLENFAALDIPLNKISLRDAIGRIQALAAQTIHQSETPDTGIEVMGMLEATGLTFDKVWIMGCHEYALPAEPSPNPFIPYKLQREFRLPRSTREIELEFAASRLKEILSSAPDVIVSYPSMVEDRKANITPLLKHLEENLTDMPAINGARLKDAIQVSGAGFIETIIDSDRIPFAENELAGIRGGTDILKNQSHCPFKAFAKHRLNAGDLPTPEYGLSSQIQGIVLHNALKALWDEISSSQKLKSMIEGDRLRTIIDPIVEEALKSLNTESTPKALIEIERIRLSKMLLNDARLEAERGDFVVLKTEAGTTNSIAGLNIEVRPDRLDRLSDGTQAVLDYKSGVCSRNDWTTRRPKEPQLLVYALKFKAAALSFVKLSSGDCNFVGIAIDDNILPGVKSFEKDSNYSKKFEGAATWDDLMNFWNQTLNTLSIDFQSGNALIDPIPSTNENSSVCMRCQFPTLCRITEREDINSRDEDNEDDEEQQ